MKSYQLLVLVHGLWGTVAHFDHICSELEGRGATILDDKDDDGITTEPGLVVYRTTSNQGYFTYDGIDVCGTRVANEVCSVIDRLEANQDGISVSTISVMGYSLGGLVSRYALGVLYQRGIFEKIKPQVFTTFCTPHVGVVVLGNRLSTRAFNGIGSLSMASTSRQLFLRDKFKDGKPLLECMAESDSASRKALEMFEERCLYANVAYDMRCEWYTAGISSTDPYAGRASLLNGPYVDGYKPTIFDATSKPAFNSLEEERRAQLRQRASRTIWQTCGFYMTAIVKMVVVIPLWFVAFLVNASFQTVTSNYRQKRFRHLFGWEDVESSTVAKRRRSSSFEATEEKGLDKLLEEGANDVVESMYRAVNKDDDEYEDLQLSTCQLKIIQELNDIGWDKYPVIIKNHHHAHAAVIVRYSGANFDEGKLIIKHWIDNKLQGLLGT